MGSALAGVFVTAFTIVGSTFVIGRALLLDLRELDTKPTREPAYALWLLAQQLKSTTPPNGRFMKVIWRLGRPREKRSIRNARRA